MNREPLAYFLTWTTYGTWLPGDDRGWTQWHKGLQPPNEPLRQWSAAKLTEQPVTLDDEQRILVDDTIRRHCKIRNWTLQALNVRTNHIHAVVTAVNYAPETVVDQIKAWCTRNLKAISGSRADSGKDRTHWWTEGASKRWINREADLEAAILYVNDTQDRER